MIIRICMSRGVIVAMVVYIYFPLLAYKRMFSSCPSQCPMTGRHFLDTLVFVHHHPSHSGGCGDQEMREERSLVPCQMCHVSCVMGIRRDYFDEIRKKRKRR